jgi:uncharacterized membrane protein YkoI
MRSISAVAIVLSLALGGLVPVLIPGGLPAARAQEAGTADIGSDRAVELARSQTSGRVLGVQRDAEASPPAYEVKILQEDGHVKIIRINLSNGATL